jgi:hypothetical protein
MPDARDAPSRDPEEARIGGPGVPPRTGPAAERPAVDPPAWAPPVDPGHRSPRDPSVGDRVVYHAGVRGINLPVGDRADHRLMPCEAEVIEWPVPGHPPGMARLRLLADSEERITPYSPGPAEKCWTWPPAGPAPDHPGA